MDFERAFSPTFAKTEHLIYIKKQGCTDLSVEQLLFSLLTIISLSANKMKFTGGNFVSHEFRLQPYNFV